MKFEYEIDEKSKDIYEIKENFCSVRNPDQSEKIEIGKDESVGGISIMANRKGWIYLAKVCFEMAYCSEKDPTFHLHKMNSLADANKDEEIAVSFYVKS